MSCPVLGTVTSTVMLTVLKCKVQEVPLRKESRKKVSQMIVETILAVFPRRNEDFRLMKMTGAKEKQTYKELVFSKRLHKDSWEGVSSRQIWGSKIRGKKPGVFNTARTESIPGSDIPVEARNSVPCNL